MIYYNGQSRNAIINYIKQHGDLHGHLYTVDDREVTTVSFELVNNNLVFTIHGQVHGNPTNALIALHDELAQPTRGATGSKDGTAGNAASDIIGQYRIYPHIRFGGKTGISLADIVEREARSWDGVRVVKPRTVRSDRIKAAQLTHVYSVSPKERPVRTVNLVAALGKGVPQVLASRFPTFVNDYRGVDKGFNLTVNEFEMRYGVDLTNAIAA